MTSGFRQSPFMPRPVRNVCSRGTDRRLVRESSESKVSRLPLPDKPRQPRFNWWPLAICLAVIVAMQVATSTVSAQITIGQKPGTDFLAFEAEDVFELVNGDDATGWGIVDTSDPFLTDSGTSVLANDTPASRQAAIFDFPDGSVSDFARYRLQFVEPGDYSLYLSYTLFNIQGDTAYGNEDSVYVSSAFGTDGKLVDTPADPRGARDNLPSFYGNLPSGGANFGDGRWEGNFEWWNAAADGSDPTADNPDAIYTPALNTPLDFGIAARERGVGIDRVVFHTNPNLSDEELDALQTFAPNTGDPGDFNADGQVDLADFLVMAGNFNESFSVVESFEKGDQTRDGIVDLADFLEARQIFNAAQQGTLASVPEPAGLTLALISVVITMVAVNRRSKRAVSSVEGHSVGRRATRIVFSGAYVATR